jgi:hypothetical protein
MDNDQEDAEKRRIPTVVVIDLIEMELNCLESPCGVS